MGNEKDQVWIPLRKAIQSREWHYVRLENRTGNGTPDVNLHVPGHGDYWLELKYLWELPNGFAPVKIGLRRSQYLWLRAGSTAGRSIGVVALVEGVWHLWTDPRAWAFLYQGAEWSTLATMARGFTDPQTLLDHL